MLATSFSSWEISDLYAFISEFWWFLRARSESMRSLSLARSSSASVALSFFSEIGNLAKLALATIYHSPSSSKSFMLISFMFDSSLIISLMLLRASSVSFSTLSESVLACPTFALAFSVKSSSLSASSSSAPKRASVLLMRVLKFCASLCKLLASLLASFASLRIDSASLADKKGLEVVVYFEQCLPLMLDRRNVPGLLGHSLWPCRRCCTTLPMPAKKCYSCSHLLTIQLLPLRLCE